MFDGVGGAESKVRRLLGTSGRVFRSPNHPVTAVEIEPRRRPVSHILGMLQADIANRFIRLCCS
jgi:hypothetical protein